MSKNILEVQHITKKFGNIIANKDISFSVAKGERLGIIGANGAGKTTLVEQLIGTSKPTSGKIKYNFSYGKSPQEKMGMQFQESSYPEGLSVKDVIEFSLAIYGMEINQKELNEIIKVFRIRDFIQSKAKGLSGGQQQKLNVLLAIAHNPEIVVLDELSTGLDVLAREEIISYVEEVIKKRKMTTILISHHMSEIERICKRVIVLKKGSVLYDGTVANLIKKHGSLDKYIRKVIEKRGN